MIKKIFALAAIALMLPAHAAVIEVGDLNIIDDAGNASDGLRFLDMTYSDGLTLVAALTNAQATYSDARLATATEWDDLFAAAGIDYDGAGTASDAFTTGGTINPLSSGSNYDAGALAAVLGFTASSSRTFIWSDPDGDAANASTRDWLDLLPSHSNIYQNWLGNTEDMGWLIVSEAVPPVPVPAAAWLFLSALLPLGWLKSVNTK